MIRLCEKQTHLDKQTLLTELAQALGFPDYFGDNWDAAWDALSELNFSNGPITIELNLQGKTANFEDVKVFIELLQEASEYWYEQGERFAFNVSS